MKISNNNLFIAASIVILFAFSAISGCGGGGGGTLNNVLSGPRTFTISIENVSFTAGGVFDSPVTAGGTGVAQPGDAYEFTFSAKTGQRLTFATMLVQSNDLFFAPDDDGIDLFPNGVALSGDITSQIELWDAGTEVNEQPGVGANQAPRQSAANTGTAENSTVRTIQNVSDGFSYPAVSELISVTVTSATVGDDVSSFTVRIDNVSNGSSLASPIAPGVYVAHPKANALFEAGVADRGDGLEALAEDGNTTTLYAWISNITDYPQWLSRGAYAVHSAGKPIFTNGQQDTGKGLEPLAEAGNPTNLGASLPDVAIVKSSGIFDTPVGSSSVAILTSGDIYRFSFTASPGDYVSFVTMFAKSNDLFYSPGDSGLELFTGGVVPLSGEITSEVLIWDAGTMVNEQPGLQTHAAPDENGTVRPITSVSDGFSYPDVEDVIKVTVTSQ